MSRKTITQYTNLSTKMEILKADGREEMKSRKITKIYNFII